MAPVVPCRKTRQASREPDPANADGGSSLLALSSNFENVDRSLSSLRHPMGCRGRPLTPSDALRALSLLCRQSAIRSGADRRFHRPFGMFLVCVLRTKHQRGKAEQTFSSPRALVPNHSPPLSQIVYKLCSVPLNLIPEAD